MVARVIDHPFGTGIIPTPYSPDPALLAIVEIIRDGLIRDHHVRLHKFGTFRLRWSKERRVKHPKTGEPVTVPPAPKITFTPAKQLREWIEPHPRPVIPLNEPLNEALKEPVDKPVNLFAHSQQDQPVRQSDDTASQEAVDQPTLQETVQDIIDEQYDPADSPSSAIVNAQAKTRPESINQSSNSNKKWALGLLAAVPLMILMLQADFTTDNADLNATSQTVATPIATPITTPGVELTTSSNKSPIIRTESITPGTQPGTKSSTLATARSEPTPRPFHMSPQLHTIEQGENLWSLAEQFYGDALLWPHIYRANMRTVSDPDKIISGKQLVIPGLQQAPESLSKKDRELIAEGYFHVYQFNVEKNSAQAVYFLIGAKQYNAEWLLQKKPLIATRDWKAIE